MTNLHSFSQLHKICETAARKIDYSLVIEHIHANVDRDHWAIAESTVIYFLPRAILDLPTKLDRREALATIPNDGVIKNLRQFVQDGVTLLWEHEQKMV